MVKQNGSWCCLYDPKESVKEMTSFKSHYPKEPFLKNKIKQAPVHFLLLLNYEGIQLSIYLE